MGLNGEKSIMDLYVHGGYMGEETNDVLDFSININPLGIPEGVVEAVQNSVADWSVYPDPFCRKVRQALASFENVTADEMICTNGASDLIFRICSYLKPKKALILAPTFSDYEHGVQSAGGQVIVHTLEKSSGFRLDETILQTMAQNKPEILFLCNPNNPTGTLIPRVLLNKILCLAKEIGCFVVVDECFLDLTALACDYTAKVFLCDFSNLLIIKAFTKTFALAGLRLGYGLCGNAEILRGLYQIAPDWNVSIVAQVAGARSLVDADPYLKKTNIFVETQKKLLRSVLEKKGFQVYDSCANYIFFYSPTYLELKEQLFEKHQIYIRSCQNYQGLGVGYYRIGVLSAEKNQQWMDRMMDIEQWYRH